MQSTQTPFSIDGIAITVFAGHFEQLTTQGRSQGALGIEVRSDRQDLIDALAPLAHQTTWLTVAAERAVSRAMGGSCSMPLAAHGTFTQGVLQLDAAWGDPEDKAPLVRAQASAPVTTLAQAEALSDAIAQRLRAGGARGVTPA